MLTKCEVISVAEAAYALRARLGPIISWNYALADMRRGRQTVCGHVLLPVCHIHDGRQWGPAYRKADVAQFIHNVEASHPSVKKGAPLAATAVELDLEDGLPWRMRRFRTIVPKPTRTRRRR